MASRKKTDPKPEASMANGITNGKGNHNPIIKMPANESTSDAPYNTLEMTRAQSMAASMADNAQSNRLRLGTQVGKSGALNMFILTLVFSKNGEWGMEN